MLRYLPPPVIMVITAALMWLTSRTPTLSFTGLPGQTAMAIGVFLIGMLLIIVAALQFYRSGTTISPIKPESSEYLITSGIYRLSRNPIYLGDLLMLLAWAIYLGAAVNLAWLALFLWYTTQFQIMREERALVEIFGQAYRDYCARVRRWL